MNTSAKMSSTNGGPNLKNETNQKSNSSYDEEDKSKHNNPSSSIRQPPPPPPFPMPPEVHRGQPSLPPTPIPIVITPAPDSSSEDSDEAERRYDNSLNDDDDNDDDSEQDSSTTVTDEEEYYDFGENDVLEDTTTNSITVNHKDPSENRHSSYDDSTTRDVKSQRSSGVLNRNTRATRPSVSPAPLAPPLWRYEPTAAQIENSTPMHRQWWSADDAVETQPTEMKKSEVSAAVPLRPSSVKKANGVWYPLSHSEPSLPDYFGKATKNNGPLQASRPKGGNDADEIDSQAVRIDFPQDDRNPPIDIIVEALFRKPELNESVILRKEKMVPPVPPSLPLHLGGDRPLSRMTRPESSLLEKEKKNNAVRRAHDYESIPKPQSRHACLEFSASLSSLSEGEERNDVRRTHRFDSVPEPQLQQALMESSSSSDEMEKKDVCQTHYNGYVPEVPKPALDSKSAVAVPVHVEWSPSGYLATDEFQYVPVRWSAHPEEPVMWRQIHIQNVRPPPINRYVHHPVINEATRRPYASDTQIYRTHHATVAEEQHRRFREIVRMSYSAMVTDEQRLRRTDAEECHAPAGSTYSLPAVYWRPQQRENAVYCGEQQQQPQQQQIRQKQQQQQIHQQQQSQKIPPKKPLRHNPMFVLRDDDCFFVTYCPQQQHFQKRKKDAVGKRLRQNRWQENSDGNDKWSESSCSGGDDEAERVMSSVRYRVYARDMRQIGEIPARKRPEKDPREWRRFVAAQREPLPGDRTSRNRINADERFALYPPPAALASSDGEEAAAEAEGQRRMRSPYMSSSERKHQHQDPAAAPLRPIIKSLQPPTDYRSNPSKRHAATTNNSSTDDDDNFCRKSDEEAAVEIAVERSGLPEDLEVVRISGKNRCSHCNLVLGRGAAMIIDTLSLCYHLGCFRCHVCHAALGDGRRGADVRLRGTRLHCLQCYSSPERDSRISNI